MPRATEENSQPELPEKADREWNRSMGLRVFTSVIAIPIVLVFVWFGGWWAFAAVTLVMLLGTYELHNMMLHSGYHPLILVSLGLSLVFLVASMLSSAQQRLELLEIGIGASLLVSFLWLFLRKKLDSAIADWSLTLAFSIYLGWPLSFFLLLRGYDPGLIPGNHGTWLFLPRGAWWLLLLLLGVWGFDSGAFFTGHFFGRHKLAPRISPGKTWEGVIGGIVFSIIACLLVGVEPLGVPWYLAIVLGILLGIAAMLGDLAESLIKRQMHVKDSGQFMPGHGGILDRVDSLLFAVVVAYIFAQFIGK